MGSTLCLTKLPNKVIQRLRSGITSIDDSELNESSEEQDKKAKDSSIDLDKAWHGIHFLLTGTDSYEGNSPAFYLLSGERLDDLCSEEVLSLSADEVKKFNSYLQSVSIEQLKKNYNAEKMNKLKVYPQRYLAAKEDNSSCLNYLLWHYRKLKQFICDVAKENKAMLITIG